LSIDKDHSPRVDAFPFLLVPALRPGDIVIMDNLGSHKGKAVRRAIRAAGASIGRPAVLAQCLATFQLGLRLHLVALGGSKLGLSLIELETEIDFIERRQDLTLPFHQLRPGGVPPCR
jgi:hypothetical protein